MFLLKLFRFIMGYVVFVGKNGFPERFLNLCALNNIGIWDSVTKDKELVAKTSIASYKKIRDCARKSGMTLKIKEKHGLFFILKPYFSRKGLFAGIAFSVILTCLLTSRIWTIDVIGCEKYTREQIIDIAENYNIKIGARKSKIDVKAIREDIKKKYDLSWFSVNIDGVHLTLEVSENKGDNKIIDTKKPCNILSDTDGVIVHLEAHIGEPALKVGSAVSRGDLLISGVSENENGIRFLHARGFAIIRTNTAISESIPQKIKVTKIEEIKRRYSPYIYALALPLPKINKASRHEEHMLIFNNKAMPIGYLEHKQPILKLKTITLSENRQHLILCSDLFKKEMAIMKNSETEKKSITITKQNGTLFSEIKYTNLVKSGVERYFDVNIQTAQ